MLTSISPVGEAGRGQRWWLTAAAYAVGSVAGGASMGAAAGALGALGLGWLSDTVAVALFGAAAVIALVGEIRRGQPALPSWRRQVDEQWLRRYRGWVYGLGFGVQLGFAVATIVVTAAVYLMIAAAVLSRSLAIGAVIGLVFGAVRAAPLLSMWTVRDPAQLTHVLRRLSGMLPTARRLTTSTVALVAAAALTAAATGMSGAST